MVTIRKVPIPKTELSSMDALERQLFIVAGHLLNELNCFGKILHWANKGKMEPDPLDKGFFSNSLAVNKLMAAKVYEAWEAIRKLYQGTSLGRSLKDKMSNKGKDALKELNQYFGKENLISMIRNAYAFHYDYERINSSFLDVDERDDWSIYLSESNANSLYYVSELIVNKSMLSEINSADDDAAMNSIFDEVMKVWGLVVDFLAECMIVLMGKIKSSQDQSLIGTKHLVAPHMDSIGLPYFVETETSTDWTFLHQ